MAFYNGKDYLISIGTVVGETTTWEVVAESKSDGWETSTDQIDTTSKGSGRFKTGLPGDISWTMNSEGFAIDDAGEASKASFNKLAALHKAGTSFPIKLENINDSDDLIRGEAYITALSKSTARNEGVGFSATFQGTGEYFTTPEV